MVAMLAFGGTYAYFTASATTATSDGLKTGYVKLSAGNNVTSVITTEAVLPGSPLLTGDLEYTVSTSDTKGNYVAIKVTLTTGDETVDAGLKLSDLNPGSQWTKLSDGIYYTETAVKTTEKATVTAETMTVPTSVTDVWEQANADSSKGGLMNQDITVKIEAQSIQASYIDTSKVAEEIGKLTWAD